MWKYRCKSQLISLLASFLIGVVLTMVTTGTGNFTDSVVDVIPKEVVQFFTENPYIIWLGGGLLISGLCNVMLIANMISAAFGVSAFFIYLIIMLFPEYSVMIGIFTIPVTIIISLYGYISLKTRDRNLLRKRNISNDDELIRIYTIHHPLLEEYKEMALTARKQIQKITFIYVLGLIAIFCVMFFVSNLLIVIIAVFAYMFAFQYLARYRQSVFMPIANLLYEKCDPEACMSALIYYSQSRNHYRLKNQALMASCLIYMDDPSLAQDILITYPRINASAEMTYWSLMSYIYYLLKDESGLYRCKEEMAKIKGGFGSMALMVKSADQSAIENRIQLMNRNFDQCKQYYLNVLKAAPTNLAKADADYYIALISFVQQDYSMARLYFERTIQIGNQLYFVRNARNYLDKINSMDIVFDDMN